MSPQPPLCVLGLDGGPKEETQARVLAPVTLPPLLDRQASAVKTSFDGTSVILFDGPASAPHSPSGGRLRPSLGRQFGPEAGSTAPHRTSYDPNSGWAVVTGYRGGPLGGGNTPPAAAAASATFVRSSTDSTAQLLRCDSGGGLEGGSAVPSIDRRFAPLGSTLGGPPLTSRPATSVAAARTAAAAAFVAARRPDTADMVSLSIGSKQELFLLQHRGSGCGPSKDAGPSADGIRAKTSSLAPPGSPLRQSPRRGCGGSRGGLGGSLDLGQPDSDSAASMGFAPGVRRSCNDSFEKRYHLGTR